MGATRYDQKRAWYANYGSALDVVAPGGDCGVDQNRDGYPDGVLQQTFAGSPANFAYFFYCGTSMATPHVAGAAALLLANGRATTPDQVRQAVQATAKDLGTAGWDSNYGHGLIQISDALNYRPSPTPTPTRTPSPTPMREVYRVLIPAVGR